MRPDAELAAVDQLPGVERPFGEGLGESANQRVPGGAKDRESRIVVVVPGFRHRSVKGAFEVHFGPALKQFHLKATPIKNGEFFRCHGGPRPPVIFTPEAADL